VSREFVWETARAQLELNRALEKNQGRNQKPMAHAEMGSCANSTERDLVKARKKER